MKRLTQPGIIYNFPKLDIAEIRWLEKIQKRLAAYEDTGLEPEEIKELCTDDVAEVAKMFRKMIESGEINHLQDLLQAENDGRLVMLPPVKIGDVAFFLLNGQIYSGTIYYIRWENHTSFGEHGIISANGVCGTCSANLSDFGKTVFLTRKEAEAALAGKGGTHE